METCRKDVATDEIREVMSVGMPHFPVEKSEPDSYL